MKRKLIDRESALQIMADAGQEYHEDGDFVRFVSAVINMQTAAARIVALPTVEERRRGRWNGYNADNKEWQRTDGSPIFLVCSECRKTVLNNGSPVWNFCPYCGAEMENSGKEPAEGETR